VPGKTDDIKKLVEERLAELDQERAQLQKALSAFDDGGSSGRGRGSGRGRRKSTTSSSPRPGRRRRKGGTRSEHAEKAVTGHPGITASQIAEELKIKPNYVYRVMADLVKEGRVEKKGTGYYPPSAGTGEEAAAED
jgi:hypothetical protein